MKDFTQITQPHLSNLGLSVILLFSFITLFFIFTLIYLIKENDHSKSTNFLYVFISGAILALLSLIFIIYTNAKVTTYETTANVKNVTIRNEINHFNDESDKKYTLVLKHNENLPTQSIPTSNNNIKKGDKVKVAITQYSTEEKPTWKKPILKADNSKIKYIKKIK